MRIRKSFRRTLAGQRGILLLALALPGASLAAGTAGGSPPPREAPVRREAGSADSPDVSARLRLLGKRDIRVHDPSSMVKCGKDYWLFSTGWGIMSWRSRDLEHWEGGPQVFPEMPSWVTEVVPEQRGHFWAPDVVFANGRYLLYYSVSRFGRNTSAIALASNPTLNPRDPAFGWKDEGIVIRSRSTNNFNAIDPAVLRTPQGELWLSLGSFWSGIKLIQLNAATGRRLAPDAPVYSLARHESIEAPCLDYHAGYYYLFINWGFCCRGIESTYSIRVGRSPRITGPYRDRQGVSLLQSGGTLLLETQGPFVGPGHAGIFAAGDRKWFTCHFYDATDRGRPKLSLRPLGWDAEGWPVLMPAPPSGSPVR